MLQKERRDPIPVADVIVQRGKDLVLLERRARDPFVGRLAIPGGHVDYGETVEAAALRELREECSVEARLDRILGVYSDPQRDPRGHRISIVFIASWISGEGVGGDDADSVIWYSTDQLARLIEDRNDGLAFDHSKILEDYLKHRLKASNDLTFWSTRK